MHQTHIDNAAKSTILKIMVGVSAARQPEPVDQEPVNALDLEQRMGIPLNLLGRAIGADQETLEAEPRARRWQSGLRLMSDLWDNLLALFGDEANAQSFLKIPRPEFRNKTALDYFQAGRPGVVLNLVIAMREMLP
jgi:hypothetical protein